MPYHAKREDNNEDYKMKINIQSFMNSLRFKEIIINYHFKQFYRPARSFVIRLSFNCILYIGPNPTGSDK